MSKARKLTGMLATGLLVGLLAGGCVEEETSIVLRGVVAPEGSVEESSVTCGGEEMGSSGTEVSLQEFTCSDPEAGSAENFWGALGINLKAFESGSGQLSSSTVLPGDNEICSAREDHSGEGSFSEAYRQEHFRQQSFTVTFDTINQLKDSRESGSQGQGGGGGGGFELGLDQNDVETTAIKVRFPNVSNTGPGGLGIDRDIRQSLLIDSGGGAQIIRTNLFEPADFLGTSDQASPLRRLHEQVVRERAGFGSYNERAKRTTVTIDAEIWIAGETVGGREVESNRLDVPIRLCGSGCGTTPMCDFSSGN